MHVAKLGSAPDCKDADAGDSTTSAASASQGELAGGAVLASVLCIPETRLLLPRCMSLMMILPPGGPLSCDVIRPSHASNASLGGLQKCASKPIANQNH